MEFILRILMSIPAAILLSVPFAIMYWYVMIITLSFISILTYVTVLKKNSKRKYVAGLIGLGATYLLEVVVIIIFIATGRLNF